MENTNEWLENKLIMYNKNPKETLEDLLLSTIDVMIQFKNNPTSKTAKGVFESCIEHNELFLNTIETLDNYGV